MAKLFLLWYLVFPSAAARCHGPSCIISCTKLIWMAQTFYSSWNNTTDV